MHSKTSKSIKSLNELRERATNLGNAALIQIRGNRRGMIAIAAAGLTTAAVLLGASALTDGGPTARAETVAVAEAGQRQQAANRADRAARTPAQATKAKVVAPKAAAKAAPKAKAVPARKVAPKAAPKWVVPMPGAPLSSCFGPRWGTMHMGIDFAGKNGTLIRSIGAGRVFAAGWNYTGYGNSVVIDHGNGYLTHYAHASRVLVKPGHAVKPNQPIAVEGSTGDSTGPHLHFEIHRGLWNQIEPAKWLRAHGVKIGC